MKTYKTSDLAHAWAYQESESGKCPASFFFERGIIYSYGYHFPICKRMEVKGQVYYFWNDKSYSNSTARHQGRVMQAIPDRSNIINIIAMPDNCPDTHAKNIEYFANRIIRAKNSELKARAKKDYYSMEACHASHKLQRYCELFDIPVPESLLSPDSFDIAKYNADKAAAELQAKKLQIKKNKARIKIETKNFRIGNRFSNYYFPFDFPFDLLRLSTDKTMVETSQGVTVDVRPVKILWCMLQSGTDITGRHCGKYEIKEVTKKTVKVGCHTFERKEILNLINQME